MRKKKSNEELLLSFAENCTVDKLIHQNNKDDTRNLERMNENLAGIKFCNRIFKLSGKLFS